MSLKGSAPGCCFLSVLKSTGSSGRQFQANNRNGSFVKLQSTYFKLTSRQNKYLNLDDLLLRRVLECLHTPVVLSEGRRCLSKTWYQRRALKPPTHTCQPLGRPVYRVHREGTGRVQLSRHIASHTTLV